MILNWAMKQRAKGWTYRILHYPSRGYLPVYRGLVAIYALDNAGRMVSRIESATEFPHLFLATKEDAEAAIEIHSTKHDSQVVWEG